MAKDALLTQEELESLLAELDGWSLDEGKLHRRFVFGDFVTAFAFMAGAALVAERANHHPEWFNVYNRVDVWLTTHDAGGLTALDRTLAQQMQNLARDA